WTRIRTRRRLSTHGAELTADSPSACGGRVAVDGEVLRRAVRAADLEAVLDRGQRRVRVVMPGVLQPLEQVEQVHRAGGLVAGALERVGRVAAVAAGVHGPGVAVDGQVAGVRAERPDVAVRA